MASGQCSAAVPPRRGELKIREHKGPKSGLNWAHPTQKGHPTGAHSLTDSNSGSVALGGRVASAGGVPLAMHAAHAAAPLPAASVPPPCTRAPHPARQVQLQGTMAPAQLSRGQF